jgi:hypothetical protein
VTVTGRIVVMAVSFALALAMARSLGAVKSRERQSFGRRSYDPPSTPPESP